MPKARRSGCAGGLNRRRPRIPSIHNIKERFGRTSPGQHNPRVLRVGVAGVKCFCRLPVDSRRQFPRLDPRRPTPVSAEGIAKWFIRLSTRRNRATLDVATHLIRSTRRHRPMTMGIIYLTSRRTLAIMIA